MSHNPAFQIGQQIGNNFGQSFKQVRDENAIEKILGEAISSGDPEVYQSSIGKILSQVSPQNQQNAMAYLQNASNNILQRQALQKKETEGRQAAKEGGYTHGAPAGVQTAQIKANQKKSDIEEYNKQFGNKSPDIASSPETLGQIPNQEGEIKKSNSDEKQRLLDLTGHPVAAVRESAKAGLKVLEKEEKNNIAKDQLNRTIFESDRAYHTKKAEKIIERNNEFIRSIPQLESNLRLIREASPKLTTKDYIADILHYEPFRTASGAQLKAATKDFLFKTIISLGGRQNQWIEQQAESALTKSGRPKEANLTVEAIKRFELEVEKKRSEIISRLAKDDKKEFGYEKGDLDERAAEELVPYVQEREDVLSYRLREQYENEDPTRIESLDKVPQGTALTSKKARYLYKLYGDDAEKVAKNLGYMISPAEFYEEDMENGNDI